MRRGSFRSDRKKGNKPIVRTLLIGTKDSRTYVQAGACYSAGGKKIDMPDYVLARLGQLTKDQLARLGFEKKFGKIKAMVVEEPEPLPLPEPDDDEKEAEGASA